MRILKITIPFVVLFLLFLITPGKKRVVKMRLSLNPQWYKPETPREDLIKNSVILNNCWICHALWVGPPTEIGLKFAHPEVKLQHGKNDDCFNCHVKSNRSLFVGMEFSGIMESQVAKLCGRCHGTYYRAWEEGRHGLRRGNWLSKAPFSLEVKQCNECHNPHSPKYKLPAKLFTPPPVRLKKVRLIKVHFSHGGL